MKRIWPTLSGLLVIIAIIFVMWTTQEARIAAMNQEIQSLNKQLEQVQLENKNLIENNKHLQERLMENRDAIQQLNKKVEARAKRVEIASVSRGGYQQAAADWIVFRATFYNLGVASTGKTPDHPQYGITRSGRKVEDGVTIAVDPTVIPLGSIVQVKYPNGRIETRRADDTGSAIKGYKIDLYEDEPDSALLAKGVVNVQIRILKRAS